MMRLMRRGLTRYYSERGGERKYRSLKEKQRLERIEMEEKKMEERIVLNEGEDELVKAGGLGRGGRERIKTKMPTKIWKAMHYPYAALSLMEMYSTGWNMCDSIVIRDLMVDLNTLHSIYYSYYYLVIFYRSPQLLTFRSLIKRLALVLPPVATVAVLSWYPLDPLYALAIGSFPIVTSAIVDMAKFYRERQLVHEDMWAKNKYCFALWVIFTILAFWIMSQKEEQKRLEMLFKKYNERNIKHHTEEQAVQHPIASSK